MKNSIVLSDSTSFSLSSLGSIASPVSLETTKVERKKMNNTSKAIAAAICEEYQHAFFSCVDSTCDVLSFRFSDYAGEYTKLRFGISLFEISSALLKVSGLMGFDARVSTDPESGEHYFVCTASEFLKRQRETFVRSKK